MWVNVFVFHVSCSHPLGLQNKQDMPQLSFILMRERSQKSTTRKSSASRQTSHNQNQAGVLWIIAVLIVVFAIFILFVGSQPNNLAPNRKLFPLFENDKYHTLEKKLDSNPKVILVGDDDEGLGIFIDQYVHERDPIINIKRRNYQPGANIMYPYSNVFAKGYHYLKTFIESIISSKANKPTLWVIEYDDALSLEDVERISEFAYHHMQDKFLVTAEVVPPKANRYFKVFEYEQIPRKFVSQLLYRQHKLDKTNARNLLSSFGGDLQKLNQNMKDDNYVTIFSRTYQTHSEELDALLNKSSKIKPFLDRMCKEGQVKTKNSYEYIPRENKIVRFNEGVYRWRNIRSIFAFSDKYNVECNVNVHVDYVHGQELDWSSGIYPISVEEELDEVIVVRPSKGKPKTVKPKEKDSKKAKSKTAKGGRGKGVKKQTSKKQPRKNRK